MFEVDNRMELIKPVLLNNYFTEEKDLMFINDRCKVEVDLENENYNIYWREEITRANYTTSSDNLNLYFLFGFLSAHDLIDRNFNL